MSHATQHFGLGDFWPNVKYQLWYIQHIWAHSKVSFGRCLILLSHLDAYRALFSHKETTFGKLFPAVFPDTAQNERTKEESEWLEAYHIH
jgi:hypothetical protein